MVANGFKHIRVGTVGDVLLVEVMSKEIQGPDLAREFIDELIETVNLDADRPVLLDLGPVRYLSSMGYSALFKMVKMAKERRRPIRFCNMHEDVRTGADAINMSLVVPIHENAAAAMAAFAQG